jgi:hypothetical protein
MPEEITVTPQALGDMRDVLLEHGFVAAEHASDKNIVKKIEKWWPGGVPGFLKHHGYL